MRKKIFQYLLRLLAVILPVYMIYYGDIYEHPKRRDIVILKWYLLAGICLYLIGATVFAFTR